VRFGGGIRSVGELERDHVTDVSVLGTGLMGSAIARSLLSAGRSVTVWNRTAARALLLGSQGASVASTVTDALDASPLAIVVVSDTNAARKVLGVLGEHSRRLDLVNLTTGSMADAEALAAFARTNDVLTLEGTVVAFPAEVGGAHARVMFSGSQDVWERHRETLVILGGGSEHISSRPGAVRALNNANECFFIPALVSMMEAAAYGKAAGVSEALVMRSLREGIRKLAEYCDYAAPKLANDEHATEMATIEAWLGGAARSAESMKTFGFDARLISAAEATLEYARDNGEGPSDITSVYRSELSAARARVRSAEK
jgi:3-hydroxyisobutyrate dehydrogenase-like beta-hydroxyacid dehydrogenase